MTDDALLDLSPQLAALWGKERSGTALLLEHLLDTAAVAEVMWDAYLAPATRRMLDRVAGEVGGRRLFAWLCGIHDVGKATPPFQSKSERLARLVRDSGLTWPHVLGSRVAAIHHTVTGAAIIEATLRDVGWGRAHCAWVGALVAGHHGLLPPKASVRSIDPRAVGGPEWRPVQRHLVERVAGELEIDLADLEPASAPTIGEQLELSGLIIMADWIASNEACFGGELRLERLSIETSRTRAYDAWSLLRLRGGWNADVDTSIDHEADDAPLAQRFKTRFGFDPAPSQLSLARAAESMDQPGLLVLEAPMGEGKTEAALFTAEIAAARFGLNGIFVGMPTQATSDPMFSRVRAWLRSAGSDAPVQLLHGKRRFNPEWNELWEAARTSEIGDEYGIDDDYGLAATGACPSTAEVVDWFCGANRPLLSPVCVGTIDHLLLAGAKLKHVALRHAGLGGKVVVLDEVHAYSVYMRQFLFEALSWLGSNGVPVIILTATLPPSLRLGLLDAYSAGAAGERSESLPEIELRDVNAYPRVTSIGGSDRHAVATGAAARMPSARLSVELIDEPVDHDAPGESLITRLDELLADGGRALIVRNTVARAQSTYAALAARYGGAVELLHARFTDRDRAEKTTRLLDELGPAAPQRYADRCRVLVATQVAEQSFDIDVDLVVSDLAPIDLLLQRAGRGHRHRTRDRFRPPRLAAPRLIVGGVYRASDGTPSLPYGSKKIYLNRPLLRALALLQEAAQGPGWALPDDIAPLVARAYGHERIEPESWAEAVAQAGGELSSHDHARRTEADRWRLSSGGDRWPRDLYGLNSGAIGDSGDDGERVVVRDGEESVEVVLVRQTERGFTTLDGSMFTDGSVITADADLLIEAASSSVRLPPGLSKRWLQLPPPERAVPTPFAGSPLLRRLPPLVLDDTLRGDVGGVPVRYDRELGLVEESRLSPASGPASAGTTWD